MLNLLKKDVLTPFVVHLCLFVLIVTGILPRAVVPFWTAGLLLWAALVPPARSVPFFVAAIPLFIAIPVTVNFDNLNMWRPLALVIFLRWFLSTQSIASVRAAWTRWRLAPLAFPIFSLLAVIAFFAFLSVFRTADMAAAMRRIIFFVNAGLVPAVLFFITRHDAQMRRTVAAAVGLSAILVTTVAFIQLASTYVMDVYTFMYVWGEGIQLRQFGTLWSHIAVWLGNTWLAYYGPQLSLRIFSLFPDSHSFPVYTILALAGVFAFTLRPITDRIQQGRVGLMGLLRTRATLGVIWIPLALLAVILSGTRGIWAAATGLPVVILLLLWWMRPGRTGTGTDRRPLWRYLSIWVLCFYLLFTIAWPIFVSPQFLLASGDRNLLGNRIRSIVDFGETSNNQRLDIWSATLDSIAEHPFLGVGIGNFPVVLDQHVILAKAGSTAHNIWLHVAAEIGVVGLAAFIFLWWIFFTSTWQVFIENRDAVLGTFAGWLLLAIPWIAAYLLTDAALFDGRTLLLFGTLLALIRATERENHA